MNEQTNKNASSDFLKTDKGKTKSNSIEIPSISLPKGGGALKGIDEKFQVNAANGTASFSIPIPFSAARGASPSISLSYNSGAGNGVFGLGWNLGLASIKRKTDKKLPEYLDGMESDTFLFSEAEDLVPEYSKKNDGSFLLDSNGDYIIHETISVDGLFQIRFYIPRIEGLFARIERWTEISAGTIKWRVITKDNVTTLFGWTNNSVICDPENDKKIFEWLPEFIFDDKGNCSHYIYKKEDATGFDITLVHNRNRFKNGAITYTNIYLEKIMYGNKLPYKKFGDSFPAENSYLFKSVFDYGEYDSKSPYAKIKEWDFRSDAFSDFKAGFEIRTTRLCKRVLLYHLFDENEYNGLVRSLDFQFDIATEQDFTFLVAMSSRGYIKMANGDYSSRKLPSLEFQYQEHHWNKEVKEIGGEDLVHAPSGLDDGNYQFTDLFNEGLSGILSEHNGGWYYKHNEGNGHFGQMTLISPRPSFAGLGNQLHLADLDADGGKQLVSLNSEPVGYFELDDENYWQSFKSFQGMPNLNLDDSNVRMIDLNGDGKPELLITEENAFTWYQSLGRAGFSAALKTQKPFDEEAGPRVVFKDSNQTIFLADMSGDGMTDIVRIRNKDISYWPNLGYGKFGARITMGNAPIFDSPDAFNPSNIRLADIDGSGTTDIIYLGKNKFSCWLNLSGNTFSLSPWEIDAFPSIDSLSRVSVMDLLGNGVSCIVWSSSLSKDAGRQMRYVDLMNSKKPHVLVSYKNNLGKEVSMEYAPSTKFYLEDKVAGKPWVTKLHFPVHCITKTIIRDKLTGALYSSSYKYHHGYYDHAEREFRGFGMVEQVDAEDYEHWIKTDATNITSADLHQEPVVSKTWYHTGAFIQKEKILTQFAKEYWYEEMQRQGFAVSHNETALSDARIIAAPGLPSSLIDELSVEEWREALRACKSMALRSEVFALDATKNGNTTAARIKELTPFTVGTHNCFIELIQPKGKNRHAVFIVKESESITYNYERQASDPRIAHTLNIVLDKYGNVLESAAVVYPRLVPDVSLHAITQQEQQKTIILYARSRLTNDIIVNDEYRLRVPAENETFELKGVSKSGVLYIPSEFINILADARSDEAQYHELEKALNPGKAQRRLIEHTRSVFYKNDLTGPLALYQLESRAIPYQGYQLAYSPELLSDIFGPINVPGARITDAIMNEGRFTHSEADTKWWVRSGTTQFIEGAETATDAQNRFFAPLSYTDPYGATTKVKYYSNYFMFIKETEDPLGNKSSVEALNFRTLSPQRMKDINGNLSEAILDELGLVKAIAIMGKGNEADELTGISDITDATELSEIQAFFQSSDSLQLTNRGKGLLKHATARFVYDLDRYSVNGEPTVVSSINREQHFHILPDSPIQIGMEYSNGIGEVLMKKVQVEPGLAKNVVVNPDNTIVVTEINTAALLPKQLRWLVNGRVIKNNKGNPVKKYEPYFSITWNYEDYKELAETGVTSVLYYDAVGRVVKTVMPDETFSKVEFDSWKQASFDANDTVKASAWYTNRTNRLIDALLIADGKDPLREKEAADKAAKHDSTPNIMHSDTLGRPILSIDYNKNISTNADEFYSTQLKIDTEGNLREVIDAKDNKVMQYKYDMLGNLVYQKSMDAGQRWLLLNIMGKSLRTWDERNHEFQYYYDSAHRPTQSKVVGGDGIAALDHIFDRIIYGESLLSGVRTDANRFNEPTLQNKNILGQVIQHYDTGGLVNTPAFDFKGKPLSTNRHLFKKYKEVSNWIDANLLNDLEPDAGYTFISETDALGRITKQIAPDGSVITPQYNEAGLLFSEAVLHPGAITASDYLKAIEYNEKRQRSKIIYGNNVSTKFYYDKQTFRLKRMESKRLNGDPLQDWYYTFDPVGNITHIEDKNIPIQFFDNQKVAGVSTYTYDALYRLAEATGRENDAALEFGTCDNWNDKPFLHSLSPGDPIAARNYTQQYKYDSVGNILEMKHFANGGNWTRGYEYETTSNRLKRTFIGDNGNPADYTKYKHHLKHGYLEELPHLEKIEWNFKEEIVLTTRQHCTADNIPVITYYQYDSNGQRIRKITENAAVAGGVATPKEERIYISGYELYKKHTGVNAGLERVSLSLMDEGHRFVMVETRYKVDDGTEKQLIRYQMHNHLGSAALELDDTAEVISYEEYHPYGTSAYQATNKSIKSAIKRYRYTGLERDEETGLEYHSARYYLPWLARWCSSDPIGLKGGLNYYSYSKGNPICFFDKSGHQAAPVTGSERIVRALEAADRANFDTESVNNAMDAIQSEIDSRGFSYNFTRDAVLSYTLLRAEAYARNASLGNYGAATFHGTMGVIDSFGYALYGDTPGETGRNFAISLVLGATFSRLAAAGRAAQLESAASRELIAARLASRRAALTPPEPITPPVSETPPTLPPSETPVSPGTSTVPPTEVSPVRPSGGTSPAIDPEATPPSGTRTPPTPLARILTTVRDGFFAMSDSSNPRFQATGSLSADGTLTVTIRTVLENGVRSTVLRGAEAFQGILRHFGSAVRTIRGSWSYGNNLARFNELTAGGMSSEAAAAQTWTGQQAAAAGFTRVTIGSLEGTAGHYTNVQVTFSR